MSLEPYNFPPFFPPTLGRFCSGWLVNHPVLSREVRVFFYWGWVGRGPGEEGISKVFTNMGRARVTDTKGKVYYM